MITFTLETIKPELAREYLSRNTNNRAITKDRVTALARDMQAGVFVATHQTIAFNGVGELIDGQHRLNAIVQSGVTVQVYVARYEHVASAMSLPFDNGLTRRHYDLLECSRRQSEIAAAILRLLEPGKKTLTTNDIGQCITRFSNEIDMVISSIGVTAKHRSSAGAKAAIALLCNAYQDEHEAIIDQFSRFVSFNLEGMWPSVAACVRCLENIRATSGSSCSRMVSVRVWTAFKPENKNFKMIRICDEQPIVDEMRDLCC